MGVNKDVISSSGKLKSNNLKDIFYIKHPISFLEKAYPGFYEEYLSSNDANYCLELIEKD